MKAPPDDNTKAIYSVTETARGVGLSRARFYELVRRGVFPGPEYDIIPRRPLYTRYAYQACVRIRKTGIGADGQPVLFNSPRKVKRAKSRREVDPVCRELNDILKGLGFRVTYGKVKDALDTLYPNKTIGKPLEDEVIRRSIQYFSNNGI